MRYSLQTCLTLATVLLAACGVGTVSVAPRAASSAFDESIRAPASCNSACTSSVTTKTYTYDAAAPNDANSGLDASLRFSGVSANGDATPQLTIEWVDPSGATVASETLGREIGTYNLKYFANAAAPGKYTFVMKLECTAHTQSDMCVENYHILLQQGR